MRARLARRLRLLAERLEPMDLTTIRISIDGREITRAIRRGRGPGEAGVR